MSAPVFHNVMEGALRLMDVPPDDIDTWLAAQAAAEAQGARRHAVAPAQSRRRAAAATTTRRAASQ